jgi:phage tail-like protein
MPSIANPTPVKQRFRFGISVGQPAQGAGPVATKFRSCSELSVEVANSQIFHGGSIIPFKMPGRTTFSDVTLDYGATKDGSLYAWLMQGAVAGGTVGGNGFAFKRPVDIIEFDRPSSIQLNRWHLANAWPTRFVAGEWDNESDDFTISSVTLTYDFFAPTKLSGTPLINTIQSIASRL